MAQGVAGASNGQEPLLFDRCDPGAAFDYGTAGEQPAELRAHRLHVVRRAVCGEGGVIAVGLIEDEGRRVGIQRMQRVRQHRAGFVGLHLANHFRKDGLQVGFFAWLRLLIGFDIIFTALAVVLIDTVLIG